MNYATPDLMNVSNKTLLERADAAKERLNRLQHDYNVLCFELDTRDALGDLISTEKHRYTRDHR